MHECEATVIFTVFTVFAVTCGFWLTLSCRENIRADSADSVLLCELRLCLLLSDLRFLTVPFLIKKQKQWAQWREQMRNALKARRMNHVHAQF